MVKTRNSDKLVDDDVKNIRRSKRRENKIKKDESESNSEIEYVSKKRTRNYKYHTNNDNYDSDDDDMYDDDYDDNYDNNPMTSGKFIVPDTYVEYIDGRVEYDPSDGKNKTGRRYKWMTDVDDKTYKKYEAEYDRMIDDYNSKEITVIDILKSNLSNQQKCECYEFLLILNTMKRTEGETEGYMNIRRHLYKLVKKTIPLTQEENDELERFNKLMMNDEDLSHKIIKSKHPDNVKLILLEKYDRIKNYTDDDEHKIKMEEWINTCLKLPTDIIELSSLYKDCNSMLLELDRNLNNGMYGQRLVKQRIMEIITAMWTSPGRSRNCMVFLGSPGVGKTEMARLLANSIGLPFYQISFGGTTDSSLLKGHSYTYIGSKPGEITTALISMGVKNGVLFLDELDKIMMTPHGQEVSNTLLHILDYTQNNEFKDNYLHGIPIDLSKLIIVVSVNSLDSMNSILRDRLPIVTFNDYSIEDKVNIGTDYIVPKIIKNLNLNQSSIKYDKNSIAYIIEKSIIKEAGVRQLERNLLLIFERINLLIQLNKDKLKRIKTSYEIPKFKLPLSLDNDTIDILFEEHRKE